MMFHKSLAKVRSEMSIAMPASESICAMNDLSIVADRVCAKYEDEALAASVRSKIMAGANWVPYDLQLK